MVQDATYVQRRYTMSAQGTVWLITKYKITEQIVQMI